MADLHPTVEACVMRSFCDATFNAAERRSTVIDRLLGHIHRVGQHAHQREGCPQCGEVWDMAFDGLLPRTTSRKERNGA